MFKPATDRPQSSRYWARARSWARANTKTYTLPKAVPPVLAAIVQYLVLQQQNMHQVVISIAIIVGGYIALYGLEFTWKCLFRAPVALDAERHDQVSRLTAELEEHTRDPAEQHHHTIATQELASLFEVGKQVLRRVWTNGAIEEENLRIANLETDAIRKALDDELRNVHLLQKREWHGFSGDHTSWDIPPGFRSILGKLLYSDGK